MAASANLGLSAVTAAGLVALDALIGDSSPTRAIYWQSDILQPEVVVEESHYDEMMITEHPVETGSAISDHAYKRPSTVMIRAAWSKAAQFQSSTAGIAQISLTGFIPKVGDPTYLSGLYDKIISLQKNQMLFTIQTGKKLYPNMLLKSVELKTEETSENILSIRAECQEIIFTSTTTTQTATTNANWGANYGPTSDTGTNSAQSTSNFNSDPAAGTGSGATPFQQAVLPAQPIESPTPLPPLGAGSFGPP